MRHKAFAIVIGAALGPLVMAAPGTAQSPASTKSSEGLAQATKVPARNEPQGSVIISQIHNAPGWQHDHTYTYASGPYTRVVNGPGWNETKHSYNPGEPLGAYQLTSTGKCTSAASGGPSGTGAAITDGTCSWKYLSVVDYVSLTGWASDNQPWKGRTLHFFDTVVSDSPLRAYALSDDSCSSVVAPTGTGIRQSSGPFNSANMVTTSDGCHWIYMADVIYTSGKSYIPTVTYTASVPNIGTIQMKANHEAQLWNDRVYTAGQNGEASPIYLDNHEHNGHGGGEGGLLVGCAATGGTSGSPCHRIIITTAPGESFADSLNASDPLPGFDPSKGVAIYNDHKYQWPTEPAGIQAIDPFVDIIGLQIKSIHGAAFWGLNSTTVRRSILDGGSLDLDTMQAAVWLDAGPDVVENSLIISHGAAGVASKYPMFVLHTTIAGPDRIANSVGIETGNKWVFDDTTVADTAIFGFMHAGSTGNAETSFSARSGNNVTDSPVGDSGMANWVGKTGAFPVKAIPNTTYGASMASAFVDPGHDWRSKNGGPLVGKGSAFGDFTTFCAPGDGPRCVNYTVFNFDSPDIIGTPRPQNGRYDIGASQSCSPAMGKGDARRPGVPVSGQLGEGGKC
jgi:hypothetical protein